MTLGTTTPPVGGTHDGPPRLLLTLAEREAVVRAVGAARAPGRAGARRTPQRNSRSRHPV